jgi:phosphoserine phosphatase RsbU/P
MSIRSEENQPSGSAAPLPAALAEIRRLETLVHASKLINSTIEGDALYDAILDVVRTEIGVERGTLFVLQPDTRILTARLNPDQGLREIHLELGQGLAGTVALTGQSIIVDDAYADDRFDTSTDRLSGFRTRNVLCAPIRHRGGDVVGVLQLLNKRAGAFDTRDLTFLEAMSEHMALAIANAHYHRQALLREALERELQLAAQIQGSLIASPPEQFGGLELALLWRSCSALAGDFIEFFHLDGRPAFIIADVSGKGVGAALVASAIQSALRLLAEDPMPLPELGRRLNRHLHSLAAGGKYVTAFLGVWDEATGRLAYLNAGHPSPYLVHDGTVTPLEATGFPMGLFAVASYEPAEVWLPPGAVLGAFTDGINEAVNEQDEELGLDPIAALLQRMDGETPQRLLEELLALVEQHRGAAARVDDETVIVLRRPAGES